MKTMNRTQIYLTYKEAVELSKLAKKLGIKKSELIRRIIDKEIEKYETI
jgi:predicted DNA-binding protein